MTDEEMDKFDEQRVLAMNTFSEVTELILVILIVQFRNKYKFVLIISVSWLSGRMGEGS